MREIKFRMWSNDKKSYFYDILIVLECLKNQMLGYVDYIKEGYVFEQYTGLKDKNGVKIFEGDILKLWRSVGQDNSLRGEHKPLPVVYDNNWCQFVVIDYELKIQYGIRQQFGAFEVIGNIHDEVTP